MSRERLNRFTHKCDEYPNFVPLKDDRIKIDTQMLISANSNKPHAQTSKKKDLVHLVTKDISSVIKKLVAKYYLFPRSIRVFLKVIILASRGIYEDHPIDKLDISEIKLLSGFLVAGWLNIPFKNPRAFGGQPLYQVSEVELEYKFYSAARITFEHLMMMQLIPSHHKVAGIAIDQLNAFIREQAHRVYVFWCRLLQVTINHET